MSILLRIRNHLINSLTDQQKKKLRAFQAFKFRRLQGFVYRIFLGSNIKALSLIYGTDKWGTHWYAKHYETHFTHLRKKTLSILEIGIGGYDNPNAGGDSLRMWRTYFPKSRIFGIDIYDKSYHDERRIKTFKGSQTDNEFLESVLREIGRIDIVIDDGSHINDHMIHTFKFLFPKLSEKGMYIIEDLQTSYWPSFGGSSHNLNRPDTTMSFLKQLTDGLNHAEYMLETYEATYFDKYIVAMHFYHNIVFIQKGLSNEGSNISKPL